MNLFVRLLKVLLLFVFKHPRRAGIQDALKLSFRVWPNDLDTNGHMNNGRYLTLLDLGRLDLLLRMGAVRHAFANRWFPVLAACQVRFRKPLNLFQKFEIVTRITGWDEKWVFIEQKMTRGGRTVMHAYLKGVFMGREGTVPISRLLEKMGVRAQPEPLPEAFAAWLEAEKAMGEKGKAD